jgi:TolB-like protein
MSLFAQVIKRRLIPWIGGYLVTGFVVLEAADQMVGYEMVPEVVYRVVFTLYVWGILVAAILAWYHGEKGPQKPERGEVSALAVIVLAGLVNSAFVVVRAEQRQAIAEGGLDPRRVAVLYMGDVSEAGELDYLADGLTETLIDRLSQVSELRVVSRNGVEPFRGAGLEYDSIATVLDAGTLVDGTVEQTDGRVRVQIRMVDGNTGIDLARETLQMPGGDIIALQDSVAGEVERFLRPRIGEEIRLRDSRASAGNAEAWTQYQRAERARKRAAELTREADIEGAWDLYGEAESLAMEAAALDTGWPDPHVLAGEANYRKARFVAGNREEASALVDLGIGQVQEALKDEPSYPPALELRGTLSYFAFAIGLEEDPLRADELLESARSDLEQAVRRDPTLASAYSTLSHMRYRFEDISGALIAARSAYEADAYLDVADVILWRLYVGSYDQQLFQDARRWCDEGRRRFPDDPRFRECQLWLMTIPGTTGDPDLAWAVLDTLVALTPESDRAFEEARGRIAVAGVLRNANLADSAEGVLASARVGPEVDPERDLPGYEAAIRSITGDVNGAMDLLKDYVAANPEHSFRVGGNIHWWWTPLRSHPDYETVVGRN